MAEGGSILPKTRLRWREDDRNQISTSKCQQPRHKMSAGGHARGNKISLRGKKESSCDWGKSIERLMIVVLVYLKSQER